MLARSDDVPVPPGGDPAYVERPAPAGIEELVRCAWLRRAAPAGASVLVLPDGCVDVVATSDGRAFVAGPDAGPVHHEQAAGVGFVGLRLRPGAAGSVLGVDADELRDTTVDLGDLRAVPRAVAGALAEATTPDARLDALRSFLVGGPVAPVDGAVLAAVARLRRAPAPLGELASTTGLGERQLRRRFTRQVGYGPTTFGRIMRFRRFLAGIGPGTGESLAVAAAAAGYFDQSHLVRDCRALAGVTPSALVAAAG